MKGKEKLFNQIVNDMVFPHPLPCFSQISGKHKEAAVSVITPPETVFASFHFSGN